MVFRSSPFAMTVPFSGTCIAKARKDFFTSSRSLK